MEGHQISAGRRLPLLDLKGCGCRDSSKGVFLPVTWAVLFIVPTESWDHVRSTGSRATKQIELTDDYPLLQQIIQIPPNGFRDGNMGDDKSSYSAKEGLQIYLLSRMDLPSLPALFSPTNTTAQKRMLAPTTCYSPFTF